MNTLTTFGGGTVNGSEFIVSSAMQDIGKMVSLSVKDAITGKFVPGNKLMGLSDGVTSVAGCHESCGLIPAVMQDELQHQLQRLKQDELVLPADPVTSTLDPPPTGVYVHLAAADIFHPLTDPGARRPLPLVVQGRRIIPVGHANTTFFDPHTRTSKALVAAPAPAPALRTDAAAAPGADGAVYLFGGLSRTGSAVFGDLWRLRWPFEQAGLGAAWTRLPPQGGPAARRGHSLVPYRDALLLFGGHDGAFNLRRDVWRYNVTGGVWTEVRTAGPGPPARHSHSAAIVRHAARDFMVVFGGKVGAALAADLWLLDLTEYEWRQAPRGPLALWPPATMRHCAVGVNARLLVFGGRSAETDGGTPAWVYSVPHAQWEVLAPGTEDGVRPQRNATSCTAWVEPGGAHVQVLIQQQPGPTGAVTGGWLYRHPVVGCAAAAPNGTRCVPCADGHVAVAGVCAACGARDDPECAAWRARQGPGRGVIVAICGASAALVLAATVLVARLVVKYRRLRRMYDETRIAAELAVAVATLELEQLDYIYALEKPTRIHTAFVTILDTLKQFRRYMPQAMFTETADSKESVVVGSPGSSRGSTRTTVRTMSCGSPPMSPQHPDPGPPPQAVASPPCRALRERRFHEKVHECQRCAGPSLGLKETRATVLVAACPRYGQFGVNPLELRAFLGAVEQAIEGSAGTLVSFHHGEVVAYWGAGRTEEALRGVWGVRAALEPGTAAGFALVSGRVRAGNDGTDRHVAFHVMGAPVPTARAFAAWATRAGRGGCLVLCDPDVHAAVGYHYVCREVGPIAVDSVGVVTCWQVYQSRSLQPGEWMYQIEEQTEPTADAANYNAALSAVKRKDYAAATALLDKLEDKHDPIVVHLRAVCDAAPPEGYQLQYHIRAGTA